MSALAEIKRRVADQYERDGSPQMAARLRAEAAELEEPAPPAKLVDPITMHTSRRIVEFARTLAAELGVEDTYEDDEERVFGLLVSAAEVYVDLQTESGSLGFRTAIDCTADGLVENLDVRFDQELNR